jgi:serine/threonine-protein kinase RsbW
MLMDSPQDRLELDSRLTELIRVWPWIEMVADRLGFAEEDRFAMHLCVEEALANVILHGYRNEPGHPIDIRTFVSAGTLCITVDDQASPFSPIEPQSYSPVDETKPASLDSITPGGNGIRLLHRFAGSLSYERLSDGNRLTIAFPVPLKDASV